MRPAVSRYSVTAFDPGARDVLTVGPTRRPRATAFRASSPAPTITVGFDVLVHEVMAAMTTEPSVTTDCSAVAATAAGVVVPSSEPVAAGEACPSRAAPPSAFAFAATDGNASRKFSGTE